MRGAAGEPLPTVFPSLAKVGTDFVRGQLVLIAAGPGTGKSILALTLGLKSHVPSLYFSADSDAFTQLTRSICVLCGQSLSSAADAVINDQLESIEQTIRSHPIRFNFDASPSIDAIERSVDAYEEVYGEYPELIVVDNVTNVRSGGDDEDPFSGLEGLMDYLHSMARETGACTLGLHHVTGGYVNSDRPIPLDGVKGQITRVPEMALTLHKRRAFDGFPDSLCVSTVKNRSGKADSSGHSYVELDFDGALMRITDPLDREVYQERQEEELDAWAVLSPVS